MSLLLPALPSSVAIRTFIPSLKKSSLHNKSCFDLLPRNTVHFESLCIYALVISLILIYAHPQAGAIAALFGAGGH